MGSARRVQKLEALLHPLWLSLHFLCVRLLAAMKFEHWFHGWQAYGWCLDLHTTESTCQSPPQRDTLTMRWDKGIISQGTRLQAPLTGKIDSAKWRAFAAASLELCSKNTIRYAKAMLHITCWLEHFRVKISCAGSNPAMLPEDVRLLQKLSGPLGDTPSTALSPARGLLAGESICLSCDCSMPESFQAPSEPCKPCAGHLILFCTGRTCMGCETWRDVFNSNTGLFTNI